MALWTAKTWLLWRWRISSLEEESRFALRNTVIYSTAVTAEVELSSRSPTLHGFQSPHAIAGVWTPTPTRGSHSLYFNSCPHFSLGLLLGQRFGYGVYGMGGALIFLFIYFACAY